jgi:5,10-methylene-tetrahydrofolate dehydrogenase/methenyl tetrahydrofolate cyclohydrolase
MSAPARMVGMAEIIDGAAVAREILGNAKEWVRTLQRSGLQLTLAVKLVGSIRRPRGATCWT